VFQTVPVKCSPGDGVHDLVSADLCSIRRT
jgi:hypothetical protein